LAGGKTSPGQGNLFAAEKTEATKGRDPDTGHRGGESKTEQRAEERRTSGIETKVHRTFSGTGRSDLAHNRQDERGRPATKRLVGVVPPRKAEKRSHAGYRRAKESSGNSGLHTRNQT